MITDSSSLFNQPKPLFTKNSIHNFAFLDCHLHLNTKNMPEKSSATEIRLRPIHCQLNPLTRSDGSALLSQGHTTVLASIVGPIEAKMRNSKIDRANVECYYRPKAGMPTIKDTVRQIIVRDTCEAAIITTLHPRTTISIQLQELDDRSGLLACAVNAACLAVLMSGVPMRFTVAAVHCIIDKQGELVLDPDQCQMLGRRASFTFAYDSLERNMVTCHTDGEFDMAQLMDARRLCAEASKTIFQTFKELVAQAHTKGLVPAENENFSAQNENIAIKSELMET